MWILAAVVVVLVVLAFVLPDTIDALTRLVWLVVKAPFLALRWLVRRGIVERAWRAMRRAHGLKRAWWAAPGPGRLTGVLHGARLTIEQQRLTDEGGLHGRIMVEELPDHVALQRGTEGGVQTGDDTFDEVMALTGARLETLAAFDDPTREATRALAQLGALRLQGGALHWLGADTLRSARRMPVALRLVARVVAALTDPASPIERLRRALLATEHDGYRREVWRALVAEDALDPAWLRAHLEDASAQVWPLLAAYVADDRDARLAAYACDAAAPEAQRLMALDALAQSDVLPSRLGEAAAKGPLGLTKRIHRLYVARGVAAPVSAIGPHMAVGSTSTRAFVMRWIASSEDPAAVPLALDGLSAEAPVIAASCEVLRALGGREALAALVDVRHHEDPDVRAAAAQAIEAIRTRVGGQAGAVSVVDAQVGAVSVVDAQVGAVSVVDDA